MSHMNNRNCKKDILHILLIGLLQTAFLSAFCPIQARYLSRQSMTSFSSVATPWYTDPKIERDRSHVMGDMLTNISKEETVRFILLIGRNVLHNSLMEVRPTYLSVAEMGKFLQQNAEQSLEEFAKDNLEEANENNLVVWVGKFKEIDYWAVYYNNENKEIVLTTDGDLKPLREFGDRLTSETDAAILATANGLIEFHKSHRFCSNCGFKTISAKAGGCRRCVGCNRSIYPRLDVATIMLITSHCGQYALLGRKPNWPEGRYSTLAGFAELGETLEECCVRETYEESGVVVDRSTVRFVASQPWPFPRSLMVGFQANATKCESDELPTIVIDVNEMEDVRWFAKDFVSQHLSGGSTARDYVPCGSEKDFHIPGKASLARLLITRWTENTT